MSWEQYRLLATNGLSIFDPRKAFGYHKLDYSRTRQDDRKSEHHNESERRGCYHKLDYSRTRQDDHKSEHHNESERRGCYNKLDDGRTRENDHNSEHHDGSERRGCNDHSERHYSKFFDVQHNCCCYARSMLDERFCVARSIADIR